ncbi:MAG: hypothetical protein ACYCZO_00795 [Daejeonella sp.]
MLKLEKDMGIRCGVNNLIANKGKTPLLAFFILLLILSSCPLKQTIYSLIGNSETAFQKNHNKTRQVRSSVQMSPVQLCFSSLKSDADVVYSQVAPTDLKTPVFLLAAFAIAFNFLGIFFGRTSLTNAFGRKALVPVYPIHIKNCLFRI